MTRFFATAFMVCCMLACIPTTSFAVQATQFYSNGSTPQSGPPYPTPYTGFDLGREIQGNPTPEAKLRVRVFAIVDRSMLEVVYDSTVETYDFRRFIIHQQLPESPQDGSASRAALPFPAQSAFDIEIGIADLCCDNPLSFVDLAGHPAGTYQDLIVGPDSFDVLYRVDVGTGGFHELNTHCVSTAGYTLSNVIVTSSGSTDSYFRVAFDMDGPGGEPADPLIDCSTSGSFYEAPVGAGEVSWSRIKGSFGGE